MTCHITVPTVVGGVAERIRGILWRRGGSGEVWLALVTRVEGIVRC